MKKILILIGVVAVILLGIIIFPWIKIFLTIEKDTTLFVDVDQNELNREPAKISERDKQMIDSEINMKISVLRMTAEEYFSDKGDYVLFCENVAKPEVGSILEGFGSQLNCRDSKTDWIAYAPFLSETFQSPSKYSCVDSKGKWSKIAIEPLGFVCE